MYKSTDAGKTWKKLPGLDDTRHISRVRVHPRDPNLVYVAAIGHAFGPNEQRGVFRSKDGGKTWEKILYKHPQAGAIDLTFDPTNANVLYAALWQYIRKPWTFESGGPASGLFKSTDGGDTWAEITRSPGLPRGLVGAVQRGAQFGDGLKTLFRIFGEGAGDHSFKIREDGGHRIDPYSIAQALTCQKKLQ